MIGLSSLNREPLNQACLNLLTEAKKTPDPGALYGLHVTEWGLDKWPDLMPEPVEREFLPDHVRALYKRQNPELYQRRLLAWEPGEELRGSDTLPAMEAQASNLKQKSQRKRRPGWRTICMKT